MADIIIIGAQWGDEGKGKIVDMLSAKSQVIVRFQGGANAGHTIKVGDEEVILHLIPSGILWPATLCLIGNGVVLDPEVFLEELAMLKGKGIDTSPQRLAISPKTHLILPYHKVLDKAREEKRAGAKIGTTGRGIGPSYEDKAARIGLRAGDLASPQLVREKIAHALEEKNILLTQLYRQAALDPEKIASDLLALAPRLLPYVRDVDDLIHSAIRQDKNILFEGAQGVHLDIDHGTYPYVTSSSTISAGACCGSGISPADIDEIIGVVKAYTTRVGSGPFPTELDDATGEFLREHGHEFGATTGRPRRCGWFDAVILRESVRLNGLSKLALTKLDVLRNLPEIKICVAYELDGKKLDYPPQNEGDLERVKPVYETMPGFTEDIANCGKFEDLPEAARKYVERIEDLTGVPAGYISVGPKRDQTIVR